MRAYLAGVAILAMSAMCSGCAHPPVLMGKPKWEYFDNSGYDPHKIYREVQNQIREKQRQCFADLKFESMPENRAELSKLDNCMFPYVRRNAWGCAYC